MVTVKVLKTFVLPTAGGMIVGKPGESVTVPESALNALLRTKKAEIADEIELAGDVEPPVEPQAGPQATPPEAQPQAQKPARAKPRGRPRKAPETSPIEAPAA